MTKHSGCLGSDCFCPVFMWLSPLGFPRHFAELHPIFHSMPLSFHRSQTCIGLLRHLTPPVSTPLFLRHMCSVLITQSCQTLCNPMTVARQAPLSMEFSKQDYWSGLPFPSQGDLPDPGIEPESPALQADSLPSEPPPSPEKLFCFWLLGSCFLEKPDIDVKVISSNKPEYFPKP